MGSSAVTGIQTGPMQMSGMAGVAAARLLEWSDRREDAERVLALARARARAPRSRAPLLSAVFAAFYLLNSWSGLDNGKALPQLGA